MQSFTNKQTNGEAAVMNSTGPSPLRAPARHLHQLRAALGNQAFGRVIQAKLQISRPGDEYEREADRVADQVMRMPDAASAEPVTADAPPPISRLQRKCAQCEEEEAEEVQRQPMEEEEEEEPLQLKGGSGAAPAVNPAVDARTDSLGGGGQPLPASERAYFEPRFGYDFSQVRIHTDAKATESARAVNALAYTVGQDVVLGAGQYEPWTAEGRRLLAHELTHVIQQGAAPQMVGRAASGAVTASKGLSACLQRKDDPTPAPTCPDSGSISQEKDDLPPIPAYAPQFISGAQMLDLVNGVIEIMRRFEPNRRKETLAPLGFTVPLLPVLIPAIAIPPVAVQAVDNDGQDCKRCTANWPIFRPPMLVTIATGHVVSDRRRWVTQPGSGSLCTTGPTGGLKEVRNVITPGSLPYIVFAEFEHWSDAMVSFDLTGGRLLANVARLTPERTHLRGRRQTECEQKVAGFLASAAGRPDVLMQLGVGGFLREGYTAIFVRDFLDVFRSSQEKRDVAGAHRGSVTHPPLKAKPIEPNIDTAINPFGCDAYARFYLSDCCPGIPGESTLDVIEDQSDKGIGPSRMPWHAY